MWLSLSKNESTGKDRNNTKVMYLSKNKTYEKFLYSASRTRESHGITLKNPKT